jgi:hypothetical protein
MTTLEKLTALMQQPVKEVIEQGDLGDILQLLKLQLLKLQLLELNSPFRKSPHLDLKLLMKQVSQLTPLTPVQFVSAAKRVIENGTPHEIMKLLKRDSYYQPFQLASVLFASAAAKVIGNDKPPREILKLAKGFSSRLSPKQRASVVEVIERNDDYHIVELLKIHSVVEEAEACKGNQRPLPRKWWSKPCELDFDQRRKLTFKVIENGNPAVILILLKEYAALSPEQIERAVNKVIEQKEIEAIVKLLRDHFFHLDSKPIKKAVNKILAHGQPNDIIHLLENCPELNRKQIAGAVEKVVEKGESNDVLQLWRVQWLKNSPGLSRGPMAKAVYNVIRQGKVEVIAELFTEHLDWIGLYFEVEEKKFISQELGKLEKTAMGKEVRILGALRKRLPWRDDV